MNMNSVFENWKKELTGKNAYGLVCLKHVLSKWNFSHDICKKKINFILKLKSLALVPRWKGENGIIKNNNKINIQ